MNRFAAIAIAVFFFAISNIIAATTTQSPTMGIVDNNASLKSLFSGQYKQVTRMGFNTVGDVPSLTYTYNSSNCNAPNNGSQVQPASGIGCYLAMFQGPIDTAQFGLSIGNTPINNFNAITAAINYSQTIYGCVSIPPTPTPFPIGGTVVLNSYNCLTGSSGNSYSSNPNVACQLLFTDMSGIALGGAGGKLTNLSICSNAATSKVPTVTAGLLMNNAAREYTIRDLYIQNFVVCRQIVGAYGRNHEDNIHCADQSLYPNLVNGFPLACIQSLPASNGSFAASRIDNDECREQAFAGPNVDFTGDGVTKAFEVDIPPGGIPLWAADGIKPKVGNQTLLPNGYRLKNGVWKICGVDYSLWDISNSGGAGIGGLQVYCARKTIQTTSGSNVATVITGGTSDIPTVPTPSNLQVVSNHGLDVYPRITAVNTGANTITMSGPATVSETMPVELVQLDIRDDGCGAAVCGTKMEVRFNTPPANGINVNPQWDDPTGQVVYDIESGSDHLTISPTHTGGYRTILRYIGQAYGGVNLDVAYSEDINQLAEIGALSYGMSLRFNDIINWHANGAYAGSYGGNVAPWYVSPIAGPTTISWNNRVWLYNGARSGNSGASYNNGSSWYQGPPLGTSFVIAGVPLTAVDQAECEPLVFSDAFRLSKLAVYVTNAGSTASLKLYLYERDPQTGLPGRQLSAATAPIPIAGTGQTSINMSDYIGSPGMYWGCYVGTWTTPPSLIAIQALSSGSIPGPGARLLGAANVSTLYNSSAAQSAIYNVSGLYTSGLPDSLSGLTALQPTLQPGALSWQPLAPQP